MMLHILTTMLFLGAGAVSLAMIAAMLIDNAAAIAVALRIRQPLPALPARVSRVRVIRSPRLAPMSPVQSRAAA